jgi:hypothetical protein
MARDSSEPAPQSHEWPPHPDSIDLHAVDSAGRPLWLTEEQAAHEARCSVKTIQRRLAKIAVHVGAKPWISRRRLLSPAA